MVTRPLGTLPVPRLLAVVCTLALALACGRGDPPASDTATAKEGESPTARGSGKLFEELPDYLEFREPEPGPRAPSSAIFGAEIGRSTYSEIQAQVAAMGLECRDTSIRAMMATKREAERKKQAKAGADAVSSASWVNRKSKREENPQVRFACQKVSHEALSDRPRPRSKGRLLFVFDNAELPLRHASFQRAHANHIAAHTDYQDALAAATARFGPPTSTRGELPTPAADGKVTFPEGRSLEARWDFSDLSVRITAIHFGRKVTVGERMEVPHGIRPDAPTLGKPAGAAAAPPATPPPPPTPTPTSPPPKKLSREAIAAAAAVDAAEAAERAAKRAAQTPRPKRDSELP